MVSAQAAPACHRASVAWRSDPSSDGPFVLRWPAIEPPTLSDVDLAYGIDAWPHTERWHLGFPVALEVRSGLEGSTAQAAEWLTVRELHLTAPTHADTWPRELESPNTVHLRSVRPIHGTWLDDVWVDVDGWGPRLRAYLQSIGRGELHPGDG